MDKLEPSKHIIDIQPASARYSISTKNTKRQKRSKSKPTRGSGGFGRFGQGQTKPKSWGLLQFKCKKLRKMYETGEGTHKYPEGVVNSFFEVTQLLNMANNEQDLYNFRSLGFHRLDFNRQGQYAVWLTGNWRLTMNIEEDAESKYLLILEIVDYH